MELGVHAFKYNYDYRVGYRRPRYVLGLHTKWCLSNLLHKVIANSKGK